MILNDGKIIVHTFKQFTKPYGKARGGAGGWLVLINKDKNGK